MELEAFIALETSAARTMESGWRKHAQGLQDDIEQLINAGRWDDAYRTAQQLNMHGVVEVHRNRLEELMVSSMLFGAAQLVPLPKTSLMTGARQLPDLMSSALDQLTIMVEDDGADMVRDAVTAVIQEQENRTLQKADAAFELGARLNAAVLGTGKGMIDIGANLTTSRLVSYGFLNQAVDLQITTYQVSEVLDSRICPVCRYMHGKTFSVTQELGRVDQQLRTLDPQELRSLAPWPKQSKEGVAWLKSLDEKALQANGFGSPPYHPGCRGVLQKTGTVTESIEFEMPVLPAAVPNKPVTTAVSQPTKITPLADFELLNLINDIQDQNLRERAQTAWGENDMPSLKSILQEAGLSTGSL